MFPLRTFCQGFLSKADSGGIRCCIVLSTCCSWPTLLPTVLHLVLASLGRVEGTCMGGGSL